MKGFGLFVFLLVAAIALEGCDPPFICAGGTQGNLHETFDAECDGSPCGWAVVAGMDGDAASTTTIHPGEHGIAFTGSDVVVAKSDAGVSTFQSATQLTVTISARCDSGSFLILGVKLFPLNHTTDSPVGIYDLSLRPLATWQAPLTLTMNEQLSPPLPTGLDSFDTAIVIQKVGDGSCEVDDLSFIGGFGFGFCE